MVALNRAIQYGRTLEERAISHLHINSIFQRARLQSEWNYLCVHNSYVRSFNIQNTFLWASIDIFIAPQYEPDRLTCEQQFKYVSLSIVLQFLALSFVLPFLHKLLPLNQMQMMFMFGRIQLLHKFSRDSMSPSLECLKCQIQYASNWFRFVLTRNRVSLVSNCRIYFAFICNANVRAKIKSNIFER